jgi:hypothetical protein
MIRGAKLLEVIETVSEREDRGAVYLEARYWSLEGQLLGSREIVIHAPEGEGLEEGLPRGTQAKE